MKQLWQYSYQGDMIDKPKYNNTHKQRKSWHLAE